MSGDGKRSVAAWPKLPRPSSTLPKLLNARALVCPEELAKADMRPFRRDSAFDPTETLPAKIAVMHNAVFPTTVC
jgi:hypothetical protein